MFVAFFCLNWYISGILSERRDKSVSGWKIVCKRNIQAKLKVIFLNLRIRDGDFLTLAELADKYNVSKTQLEMRWTLEIQGYLKSLPRKGYLVKPVTQKSIRESFQMRAIFEKAAVSLV